MRSIELTILALALLATSAAPAQVTFTETFETGNIGGWTFGGPQGFRDPVGGNPGAFWHDPFIDTIAPWARTQGSSVFTGDYRDQRVTAVGIDLVLFRVDFGVGDRPLVLILFSRNGTPGDPSDDWGAFFIGAKIVPQVGQGWLSYEFEIPSQATMLPPGWKFIQFGPNAPPGNWNTLIKSVDMLSYFFGDPELFYIFQVWDVGMDNPWIRYLPEPRLGDLNCDGEVDFADINPFVLALTDPAGYGQAFPECNRLHADINQDGKVDFGDINPFVDLLTGP